MSDYSKTIVDYNKEIIIKPRKGNTKMTDSEKLIAIISYIKGVIGGNKYSANIDVEGFNSFLKTIEEK